MAEKPLVFSKHAQDMLEERDIPADWVRRVLRSRAFEEPDRWYPDAVRAYAPIVEFGGRTLRVVYRDIETRSG